MSRRASVCRLRALKQKRDQPRLSFQWQVANAKNRSALMGNTRRAAPSVAGPHWRRFECRSLRLSRLQRLSPQQIFDQFVFPNSQRLLAEQIGLKGGKNSCGYNFSLSRTAILIRAFVENWRRRFRACLKSSRAPEARYETAKRKRQSLNKRSFDSGPQRCSTQQPQHRRLWGPGVKARWILLRSGCTTAKIGYWLPAAG